MHFVVLYKRVLVNRLCGKIQLKYEEVRDRHDNVCRRLIAFVAGLHFYGFNGKALEGLRRLCAAAHTFTQVTQFTLRSPIASLPQYNSNERTGSVDLLSVFIVDPASRRCIASL